MPNPYSADMRERVIARVESGASRREAAEHYEISVSAAIKWVQRWRDTGSLASKPRGGSTSPLEEHETALLALIAEQPDLTLDEFVVASLKRKIACSRSAFDRFLKRHQITFKKKLCTQPNKNEPMSRKRAAVGSASKACLTRPIWCSLTKRQPTQRWRR